MPDASPLTSETTPALHGPASVGKDTENISNSQTDEVENYSNILNEPQEPMPMVKDEQGRETEEPDWYVVTSQRTYSYLYNKDESGMDTEDADLILQSNLDEQQKALDKATKAKVKPTTSVQKLKEQKAAIEAAKKEAQDKLAYWQQVKNEREKAVAREREEQARKDAEMHDAAVEAERQRKEAEARAKAEREAAGYENVMPNIVKKWNEAPKVDGNADEIVLPNGEKLKGHYVLTESGAASPSHQPLNGFRQTEGFPRRKDGTTVNDRDYENDRNEQEMTRKMGANYDSRALQDPVVVSQDGVVLSGNGRTMGGELAAHDGTDAAYNDYLKEYAGKYGFTPGQVEGMEHPRVVFVPDYAFIFCSSLTSVNIPNSVTSIEYGTFEDCSSLANVTIPNSVTSIGDAAFRHCVKLNDVRCFSLTPPSTLDYTFDDATYENAQLYVPKGSLNAYKQYTPWKYFKNIKEIDPTGNNTNDEKKLVSLRYQYSSEDNIKDNIKIDFTYDNKGRLSMYHVTGTTDDGNNENTDAEVTLSWEDSRVVLKELPSAMTTIYWLKDGLVISMTKQNSANQTVSSASFQYSNGKLMSFMSKDYKDAYFWDGDKLARRETTDSYGTDDLTFTYEKDLTTKGYLPLGVASEEVPECYFLCAHPELSGTKTNYLPYMAYEKWGNDVTTSQFSYQFDDDGYVKEVKQNFEDGDAATMVLEWKKVNGQDANSIHTTKNDYVGIVDTNNGLTLRGVDGKSVSIFTADGCQAYDTAHYAGGPITLPRGLYIVKAGGKVMKVAVK